MLRWGNGRKCIGKIVSQWNGFKDIVLFCLEHTFNSSQRENYNFESVWVRKLYMYMYGNLGSSGQLS